jgi:phosphinothricin acetyltransferase
MARGDDAEALQAIYAPYVRDTVITFEHEPPTVAEMRVRIERQGYRWSVDVSCCG